MVIMVTVVVMVTVVTMVTCGYYGSYIIYGNQGSCMVTEVTMVTVVTMVTCDELHFSLHLHPLSDNAECKVRPHRKHYVGYAPVIQVTWLLW